MQPRKSEAGSSIAFNPDCSDCQHEARVLHPYGDPFIQRVGKEAWRLDGSPDYALGGYVRDARQTLLAIDKIGYRVVRKPKKRNAA